MRLVEALVMLPAGPGGLRSGGVVHDAVVAPAGAVLGPQDAGPFSPGPGLKGATRRSSEH